MGPLKLDPMKALSLLVLLASALIASGQDSPIIKGHRIGESINDYLTTENGGAENAARAVTDCAVLLSNPKQRRKQQYRAETCQQIADAWKGQTVLLTGERKGGKFRFAWRSLVAIELALGMDFSAVEADLVEKFGRPDTEEQVPFENGYGAVFYHPRAAWTNRRDVIVSASEDPFTTPSTFVVGHAGPDISLIRVEIMDRAYAESVAERERQHPNPLN